MPLDPLRVKILFAAALEGVGAEAQAACLDRECPDDPALRKRVEALLQAHNEASGFLATPAGATLADFALDGAAAIPSGATLGFSRRDACHSSRPPLAIPSPVGLTIAGRYKIRQEIGEGGMGTVYMAEQVQPVKRLVAVKLIRAGMDSRTVLARFESERQALAIMDHPHIARVLDAGTTEAGHPFFVMELVRGVPLTEYCDHHRLDLPKRLDLFRQICAAVQHAHQKGIIHRDLKPTNILVEDHDGHPVPKVIDFGLAKATTGLQLTEQTLFTAFGSITGTPLYMAPEQANFNAIDVDTRADIYALGVILYELLTGSTPIRKETLQKSALDEMLRMIREVEPPTPSSRISTSAMLASLAINRHVEPARLGRFVRGDLDWIVMKALAKERVRRYDSAISLANDIERFLKNEPVLAGPPTARYRTAKFIRRHRGQVAAASLVFLVLIGGVIGTTLGLFEANRQAAEARRQGQLAIASAEKAEERSTQLGKINEVLGSIFKDINPLKLERDRKPLVALLGERLVQAAVQIEGESIGEPLAVAQVQSILGLSLIGLGYPDQAIGLLTKCRATLAAQLGPDHTETLDSMSVLALAHRTAGHPDQAIALLEQTLAGRKARLGLNHADTLTTLHDLGVACHEAGQVERAVTLFEQSLAGRKVTLGPDHPDTLSNMGSLAVAYSAFSRRDRAVPLFEAALATLSAKLGPDHPDTLRSMGVLAVTYRAAGQLDQSISLFQQALDRRQVTLGRDHPDTLKNMIDLAGTYHQAGRLDRAVPLFEQVLATQKASLGLDHPDTLQSMGVMAIAYRQNGQYDPAIQLLDQTIKGRIAKLGPDHPHTLASIGSLAMTHRLAGQLDQAISLFEQVLAGRQARLGLDHYDTLNTMRDLAITYLTAGKPDQALPLLEALAASRARLDPDHPDTYLALSLMADAQLDAGRFDLAIPFAEQALNWSRSKFGSDDSRTLASMINLAVALQAANRSDRAGRAVAEVLDVWKRKNRPDLLADARLTMLFASALLKQAAWSEAETVLRSGLLATDRPPGADWRTFDLKSLLGSSLVGQKKLDEGRPLLVAGYEGMKQRSAQIAPRDQGRLAAALDRLIEFEEADGKPHLAQDWREEKARITASLSSTRGIESVQPAQGKVGKP